MPRRPALACLPLLLAAAPAGKPLLPFTGVSLAGAEFGPKGRGEPRAYGKDFVCPTAAEVAYFTAKGSGRNTLVNFGGLRLITRASYGDAERDGGRTDLAQVPVTVTADGRADAAAVGGGRGRVDRVGRRRPQAVGRGRPRVGRGVGRVGRPGDAGGKIESPLRWTCKSTGRLAAELARRHHPVSDRTVAALLRPTNGTAAQYTHRSPRLRRHPAASPPPPAVKTMPDTIPIPKAAGCRPAAKVVAQPARADPRTTYSQPTPRVAVATPCIRDVGVKQFANRPRRSTGVNAGDRCVRHRGVVSFPPPGI